MLVRYRRSYEKTAMGLLAYSCHDKSPRTLMELVRSYEDDPGKFLYLWRIDEDFVGIIGVERLGDNLFVRHISLNPSLRGEKRSYELLDRMRLFFPDDVRVVSQGETAGLIDKWKRLSSDRA